MADSHGFGTRLRLLTDRGADGLAGAALGALVTDLALDLVTVGLPRTQTDIRAAVEAAL